MLARFASDTLVVLTTAPTGLGHTRVTEALKQGLAESTRTVTLGTDDWSMQALHRMSSINPGLRALMELVQNNPVVEGGFTRWYRQVLRWQPDKVLAQLTTIIQDQSQPVRQLVIVCTHFGLAHQIAAIKPKLAADLDVKVVLAVVVTDDSPQQIWAVVGAEVLLVPSESTRAGLEEILAQLPAPCPKIVVVPYPVSPRLGKELTGEKYHRRKEQSLPESKRALKVMIPISGAAVQLDFFMELIEAIAPLIKVEITLVARESQATAEFLGWCREQPGVTVLAARQDREVVGIYEQAYEQDVIGVEITKPSEQAFKALLTPKQMGGSVLLLSEPVGRQEEDNLHFLNRHHLLPELGDQQQLEQGGDEVDKKLLERMRSWRAIPLPAGTGAQTALYISRLKRLGILAKMVDFAGFRGGHEELSSDGVRRVWEEVDQLT